MLATAPAAEVARIGLRSDVAMSVWEWQQNSSRLHRTGMLDDLEYAEVFDVDELVPLLRDGIRVNGHLWHLVPEQWRKLVGT